MFTEILNWLHARAFGRGIKRQLYMNEKTRRVVVAGACRLGEVFFQEQSDFYPLAETSPTRRRLESAIDELCRKVTQAAAQDEWRQDLFFWPAIFTRLDAYLKVDGIPKRDRRFVIQRLQADRRMSLHP